MYRASIDEATKAGIDVARARRAATMMAATVFNPGVAELASKTAFSW